MSRPSDAIIHCLSLRYYRCPLLIFFAITPADIIIDIIFTDIAEADAAFSPHFLFDYY